jgi:hypothetical protein
MGLAVPLRLSALRRHDLVALVHAEGSDGECGERASVCAETVEVDRKVAAVFFLPIADEIESGTYLLYDGARGWTSCVRSSVMRLSAPRRSSAASKKDVQNAGEPVQGACSPATLG